MNFIPQFKGRQLFLPKNELPIMAFSRMAFFASMVAMVASIVLWSSMGLNFGVDFKGGSMIEVRAKAERANIPDLRAKTGGLGLGDVQITSFGTPQDVLIRIEEQPGGAPAQQAALKKITDAIGDSYEQRRVEVVGPAVSSELRTTGIIAVLCSIIAIILYVWFRFEWQFAIGAVVALVHDVLITIGVFSLFQFEFDLSTVAALLTILGYSVNDTVVVSDRIRENLRKYKRMELPALLNMSINETLSRTLMTSLTTLIVLVALYVLGGEVIRNFTFAMMFGIIIGTYSSIFIAAPLLSFLGVKRDWSGIAKEAPAATTT
jgi:preprotein translocase subunit SecF/SecD/SecF fusion protein